MDTQVRHPTETGWYRGRLNLDARHGGSISHWWEINKPLPWVCLAFLIAMFCVFESTKAIDHADTAKQAAFDAQTQALLLRDYVDKLRFELASHGINPPPYPKELTKP